MLSTGMTMGDAIRAVVRARPGQEVLVCGASRLTNGQLLEQVTGTAGQLAGLGVGRGDRVAVSLPPGPQFACLFFALAQLGSIIVPLNPDLLERALHDILEDSQPVVLVTENGARRLGESPRPPDATPDAMPESAPQTTPRPGDLLALLYTSGTTGKPKATVHTHSSLIAPVVATLKVRELWARPSSIRAVVDVAKAAARYRARLLRSIGRPQTLLSTAGWHTITGLHVMLQGLLMGDRLVVMKRFHPQEALEIVEKERVSVLVAVPTAWQAMLALPDFDRHDFSSLLVCASGGAACPPSLAREIRQRFGCALYNGFGMTEAAGGISVSTLADSDEKQDETVGRVMPGIDIRIVDRERREVPNGQEGELAVRGEGVMLGYYKAPELTAAVKDHDGWLYTGDLARMDAQGYLHIVGRVKDVIIRGGQNVYPAEIEDYLETHPRIREAAVVGVPSAVGGESVWAFVRLKENASMTVPEVLDYCRGTLEVWKIPSQVRFVPDLPRAESGKFQKFKLRQAAIQEQNGGTL
ncbi:MAG: class I adenylate-forming enzyme family protein [Spirochaetia bacterium]|jgi:acyl-CoA synthetase (AMP-forming)/AMP-acid ligase II